MNLYREKKAYFNLGLFMGILGMGLWVIPTISIFSNIICIYCGFQTIESTSSINKAIISLGVVGTVLTIGRAILAALLT